MLKNKMLQDLNKELGYNMAMIELTQPVKPYTKLELFFSARKRENQREYMRAVGNVEFYYSILSRIPGGL